MSAVTAVGENSTDLATDLATGDVPGTLLALDLAASDTWVDGVESTSRALIEHLAAVAHQPDGGPICLIVRSAEIGSRSVVAQAALEAMHGTVGTAALELADRRRRLNVILTGPRTSARDLAASLAHLQSEDIAAVTTGITIDLTETPPISSAPDDGVVLVTGGAGGLGYAAAEEFVRRGRRVVITDLGTEGLEQTAEKLGVRAIPCDLTSPDDVRKLVDHPAVLDGLSALVVHHGVGGSGSLVELEDGPRDLSLRVNGTGVWNVVDAALPALRAGRPGSVVVLASQAGLIAERGNIAYCAAKFAAVGAVRGLAWQEHATGVRVHALCPGPVDTPLMRGAFEGMAAAAGVTFDEYLQTRMNEVPLRRFGTPEQMGAAARYLVDLDATGVILAATGGVVLT